MKYFLFMMVMLPYTGSEIIFDFNRASDLENWLIVDDVVMGGNSSGSLVVNAQGYGAFEGFISLENNGGFSSARYNFERTSIKDYTKIVLKIKGDGKKYQFRVKANADDYYSYIASFSTNGEWQEIQIPLKNMYPAFRGRKLDRPNFSEDAIEQVAFLIGNKNEEDFKLLIDKIELK